VSFGFLRRRASGAITIAFLSIAAGCSSSRQELGPIAALRAPDADGAWRELARIRRSEPRLASYASIRVESRGTKRTFRATIETGGSGRVRVDAFTPMGTAAFTLYVERDEATMLDHSNRTWWRGPFATAARSLALPESLDAAGLAMIAFGLPVSEGDGEIRDGVVELDGVTYRVGGAGLAEASATGWTARFEPPAWPVAAVTIVTSDGTRSLTIRHLEAGAASRAIAAPKIERGYRCCVAPAEP
jgi:hypothetical protein